MLNKYLKNVEQVFQKCLISIKKYWKSIKNVKHVLGKWWISIENNNDYIKNIEQVDEYISNQKNK